MGTSGRASGTAHLAEGVVLRIVLTCTSTREAIAADPDLCRTIVDSFTPGHPVGSSSAAHGAFFRVHAGATRRQ